jgi:hypothetical protein
MPLSYTKRKGQPSVYFCTKHNFPDGLARSQQLTALDFIHLFVSRGSATGQQLIDFTTSGKCHISVAALSISEGL